ncbi:hypothetical protein Ahy_A09g045057 [Arachis hypogaea]|uniref:Uncharacterized protein n=1 Tax=Arachis hypogaea TaxID=3818 RepID=A0A445BLF7_ARAHY|nr:hypothetical protein Ahy_A09g045057 [Arachis hypogaea]
MTGKEVQKEKAKARLRAKRKAKAKEDALIVGETNNASEGDHNQNARKTVSEAVVDKQICEKKDCPWIIYCAGNSRSEGYQIKTFNPVHTYGREFGSNMADQSWVADKLSKRLLSHPRLTHAEACDHIKIDYNVIISDKLLCQSLKIARERYVGNEKSQYGKGLMPALKDVMLNVHHRNCVRHIWKNFTNKYKSKQLKNVVWACAKSSTIAEFSHWSELDNITNNMTEVWNAKIVQYKEKSILTILEELRCYIMRSMAQHKRVLSTYVGTVALVQQKRVEDIMKESKYWTAQ